MILVNRIFISAISGNHLAKKYFADFENKFGSLSGEYAEEYHDLQEMLDLWFKE